MLRRFSLMWFLSIPSIEKHPTLGDFVASRNPIERFSAGVRYSQDPERLSSDDIRNVIREHTKVNAAI